MQPYILAIDQGTTNSRAIVFDRNGRIMGQHGMALTQFFPRQAWVEQDPEEMFKSTIVCCVEAIKKAKIKAKNVIGIGISNQRETTIIWDKKTGDPIYPAIVWQDRRTAVICSQLAKTAINDYIQHNTGLLMDPYFSATKIIWILENVPDARKRAENGELLFGTVDCYLLWKLTKGKVHATDITNASRTMLFNIRTLEWDKKILHDLHIPANLLPVVKDNAYHFGDIDPEFLGTSIPILGMAGDQQAATIGQACFKDGMIKATYGTGCFMLLNTGNKILQQDRLLTTIAYRVNNQVIYGLEGSIFSAGVVVKWLRDTMHMIGQASETERLARSIKSTDGVYLVPAFTGLGAPYWDPHARGAIVGLTRSSGKAQIVRAGLESTAYQTLDLLRAMTPHNEADLKTLRVDGGMVANDWLLQFISDLLNLEVQKPVCIETSALGVAYLAGLQSGLYASLDEIADLWQMDSHFTPTMSREDSETLYAGWQNAVERVIS